MSTQENDLLSKLKTLYSKRYGSSTEFETKFNKASTELIKSGDVKISSYIKFCLDNDIEPNFDQSSPTTKGGKSVDTSSGYSSRRTYNDSGCGGTSGSTYTSSHC